MQRTILTNAGDICVALALKSTKPAVQTKVKAASGLKTERGAHGIDPSLTNAASPERIAETENCDKQRRRGSFTSRVTLAV